MACCPQTRLWRTGPIPSPYPITACIRPAIPRPSRSPRFYRACRQAVPGKKPTHTGRDATKEATGIKHEISIHAPHAGRDADVSSVTRLDAEFQSTRPIRGATFERTWSNAMWQFQSTRPIRGATFADWGGPGTGPDFNPRAPYGARHGYGQQASGPVDFNPRAPYGARHARLGLINAENSNFNPRAPYGARLRRLAAAGHAQPISIHAPHTGRDGFLRK